MRWPTRAIDRSWPRWLASWVAITGLLGILAACGGAEPPSERPAASSTSPAPAAPSGAQVGPLAPQKLLKLSPEIGPGGTSFSVSGEGLPPGKQIQFQWATWEGSYLARVSPENVQFQERRFAEQRVPLGRAVADAQGRVAETFTVPEDYGEPHDVYAVVDGQDVARGGFRILRTATITPSEGPVGTPITISMTGLGVKPYEHTLVLRYDNKYVGVLTGVTTRGTAVFQVRAAGPVGQHVLQINQGAATTYLNTQQSPQAYLYAHTPTKQEFRFNFTVTRDAGPPADTIEWPAGRLVAQLDDGAPRTTASGRPSTSGLSAAIEPASGPILSQATLRAGGLPPNAEAELFFVTARGNRMSPSGWSMQELPLARAIVGADGSLAAPFQIPDDLGGWHVVKLVARGEVLAEVPYYVKQNLVSVSPKRVKAGEPFTVQIKGVGWTELDNGVAVTYDNAEIGYACGFNSNGDVTVNLVATGGPGTHLIDLYPMVYAGKDAFPWYRAPVLTAAQDFPGLGLGYGLPTYRLAIEVLE
ncbi:MAG: hypothetical protein HY690_17825 [Chloroflexi bacterium]|nr:hypothetical protein [Chloroflexota bacterium]